MAILIMFFNGCVDITDNKANSGREMVDAYKSILKLSESCSGKSGKNSEIYEKYLKFESYLKIVSIQYTNEQTYNSKKFDYLSPMVVNQKILEDELKSLKEEAAKGSIDVSKYNSFLQKLFRFESQKCQLNYLASKRNFDLPPYLKLLHKCSNELQNDKCNQDNFEVLYKEQYQETLNNVLELCQSVESDKNCIDQIRIAIYSNKLAKISEIYFNEFREKKFNRLFKLNDNHLNFQCKQNDNKVEVELKLFSEGFDIYTLESIKRNIENTWSKNGLVFKLSYTNFENEADLKILAIDQGISHVNSLEPNIIYLNRNLNFPFLNIISAHEFGHILGFPDCYIEFFDRKTASLTYFELSNKNKNIMCTTNESSIVPNDYIDQIKSNTCKFNSN